MTTSKIETEYLRYNSTYVKSIEASLSPCDLPFQPQLHDQATKFKHKLMEETHLRETYILNCN